MAQRLSWLFVPSRLDAGLLPGWKRVKLKTAAAAHSSPRENFRSTIDPLVDRGKNLDTRKESMGLHAVKACPAKGVDKKVAAINARPSREARDTGPRPVTRRTPHGLELTSQVWTYLTSISR